MVNKLKYRLTVKNRPELNESFYFKAGASLLKERLKEKGIKNNHIRIYSI